jgi:hypothetical protein
MKPLAKMKKTTKRSQRAQRALKRALKHGARLAPAALAGLLAARTARRPERLAALAQSLARLSAALLERRELKAKLRESRRRGAGATVDLLPPDLLPPADAERRYALLVMCLHAADWPVEWTDVLHAAHSDPQQVAQALSKALGGRVQ